MMNTSAEQYPAEDHRYDERRPEGLLAAFIQSVWVQRGRPRAATEALAPTGSTVAAIVLGEPVTLWPLEMPDHVHRADSGYLIGAHDRPVMRRSTGDTFTVGVVTTPIGCQLAFGIAPASIKRRITGLAGSTLGAPELAAELRGSTDPQSMLDHVESRLAAGLTPPDAAMRRCQFVIEALEAEPTRSVDELAHQLSISHGDLDEEFKTVVGLGPRAMARVIRLQTLLGTVDSLGLDGWAAAAADHGWFDQPLLIRDFKRHTGLTPREFVRARTKELSTGN